MFRKVAVAGAISLLLVACANEAEPDEVSLQTGDAALAALRAGPEAAAEAGTAQFEMVMEMTAMGQSFEITATGAYDKDAQQGSMSMDMGSLFQQLAEAGEEMPDIGDGTMTMVFDGDTAYVRSPLFDLFTGTSGWISLSMEELGADASQLGVGGSDPSALLEGLRGVGGDPEVVGQEDVRGVPTTHYRASMRLSDALADVPESERDEVKAALEQLGDVETAEVPVDVWIDEDDLPRRMQMDMGALFGAVAGGDDATMTMTLELFGYGDPVDIEIPPADEVTPLSETLGGDALLGS